MPQLALSSLAPRGIRRDVFRQPGLKKVNMLRNRIRYKPHLPAVELTGCLVGCQFSLQLLLNQIDMNSVADI